MCIIYNIVLFQMDDRFFKDLEPSFTPEKNVLNSIKYFRIFYGILLNRMLYLEI